MVNARRFDPYKAFRFRVNLRVVAAAAAAGAAAFAVTRRLSGKKLNLDAGFLRRLRF